MRAIFRRNVRFGFVALLLGAPVTASTQQPQVPTSAPETAQEQSFRDSQFGVRFKVPAGWEITRRDHEVSTFRMDARSAPPNLQLRSVVSLDFNPFPQSTLAGALFYYSVEKHAKPAECVQQATGKDEPADSQMIGGMNFVHGHDEHGGVCVEARDEIYTAFRKGACYRFDLEMNTFCAVSSGAAEMSDAQIADVEARMTSILSTVTLDWSKSGAVPVPPPQGTQRKKLPVTVVHGGQ